MKLIFSVLDRYDIWPHFRKHYEEQGVTQFICVSYGPKLPGVYTIPAGLPVKDFTGIKDSICHNRVISQVIEHGEWFLIADLDEFAVVPGINLHEATGAADVVGATYICGWFYDRITADGSIPAQLEDDIWKQFPLATNASEVLCGGWTQKVVAVKGPTPVNGGHHDLRDDVPGWWRKQWRVRAQVHHFKWWGENPDKFFWNRFDEQGCYREELTRMTNHFRKHGGIDTTALKIYE